MAARRSSLRVGVDRKTVRRDENAAAELGLDWKGGEEELTDVFIALAVEKVRPLRIDGHRESWHLLEQEDVSQRPQLALGDPDALALFDAKDEILETGGRRLGNGGDEAPAGGGRRLGVEADPNRMAAEQVGHRSRVPG